MCNMMVNFKLTAHLLVVQDAKSLTIYGTFCGCLGTLGVFGDHFWGPPLSPFLGALFGAPFGGFLGGHFGGHFGGHLGALLRPCLGFLLGPLQGLDLEISKVVWLWYLKIFVSHNLIYFTGMADQIGCAFENHAG